MTARAPLVCDTGPNAGMYRIDLTAQVYLTAEELADYYSSELDIIIKPNTFDKEEK
jgi:hypothetical protein